MEYTKGIYWNEPSDKAPDFVKGRISIKVKDAIPYLQEKENSKGYVNIQVKVSKAGETYLELDTWEPGQQKSEKVEMPIRNVADLGPEDSLREGEGPRF